MRGAVADGLLAEVCERLGLLRRQGALILGRDEVVRAAERRGLIAVGVAQDLSDRSRDELRERAPGMIQVTLPTMEVVGGAVGTRPVGIVGVPRLGGERLQAAATRWARYMGLASTTMSAAAPPPKPLAGPALDPEGSADDH